MYLLRGRKVKVVWLKVKLWEKIKAQLNQLILESFCTDVADTPPATNSPAPVTGSPAQLSIASNQETVVPSKVGVATSEVGGATKLMPPPSLPGGLKGESVVMLCAKDC